MTLDEAFVVLDTCDWLKVMRTSVAASTFRRDKKQARVKVRRKASESFAAMVIRAAQLVEAGHQPARRVPPRRPEERCACGSVSSDLVWHSQLTQRVCRTCARAWDSAAKNNDLAPTKGIAG